MPSLSAPARNACIGAYLLAVWAGMTVWFHLEEDRELLEAASTALVPALVAAAALMFAALIVVAPLVALASTVRGGRRR